MSLSLLKRILRYAKSHLKTVLISVKIIVTILFVIVVNKTLFSVDEPLAGLVPVDLLVMAICFSLLNTLLQGYRWFIFLRIFGMNASFYQAMRSYFEGVLFAVITPGRASELLRGYSLEPEWLKMSSIAVAVERLWATVILFLVGGIAFSFLPGGSGGDVYSIAIVTASLFSFVALFLIPSLVKRYRQSARKVRRGFIVTLGLSLAIHLLLIVQVVLLIKGRLPLSFSEATAAISSALCGMQLMPVTVANMGVREFNLFNFLSLYIPNAVPEESIRHIVLSTSVIMMIANLLVPAIPGIGVLLFTRIRGNEKRK